MNIKNKIQQSFDKASSSYDTVASVQKKAAQFLVTKLLENLSSSPKTILDLGTGTGAVPELLKDVFSEASYTLNDISEQMLDRCRAKFSELPSSKNFSFQLGDMTRTPLEPHDLIMSNLALQWIENLELMLAKIFSCCNTFAFSTLIDGTFQEWRDLIGRYEAIPFPIYPAAEELIQSGNQMAQGNDVFRFWLQDINLSFETPLLLMQHLKSLGASAVAKTMSPQALKSLIKEETQPVQCSYKIFFGILRRE